MLQKIKETADYILEKTGFNPEVGIVLGSGLGGLVNQVKVEHAIPYADIPGFPVSTVQGHGSKLILGHLGGKKIVAMQGRFHFYEGYTMQEVAFPIRVLKYLGISQLFLSNASGGMNQNFKVGDLMIIDDHINLMGINPLIGKNDDELGPRFPDMSAPYDAELIRKGMHIANNHHFRCHKGVYAAVTGPCYETPAEYRYIRTIGADAVGMSTVPEVIVARHMGLPCFAISIITDMGGTDEVQVITHEEVVKVANEAEVRMTTLIIELLNSLNAHS
ncbi:MAG: purine-nucleoside phosphorylase [Bacteroidetes bacterium]|nr:purine-nucleoside phosphorylase [Bacteroidota bacterium]